MHSFPNGKIHLEHELAMMQKVDSQHVVKSYSLEQTDFCTALILEDFQAQSLDQILKTQVLDLNAFLTIAIQMAEGVGEIHRSHIIHKDINPAHILVNLNSNRAKVTGFGISTLLPRELQSLDSMGRMEGTYAYISPEQTGRVNRMIDYRTDIYSLGITLYEMLVGSPPFETEDFLELILQHIATLPTPPHTVHKEIPEAVSNVIMKCLEKDAEKRYYSAFGLKKDLEICLRDLKSLGRINPFTVGEHDVFDHWKPCFPPSKASGKAKPLPMQFL
jgi:serine/threonine protein kinase